MEFLIISGLSGAGKSRAASVMEDLGYFCVDNLPVPLIPKFAELGMGGNGEYDRVVLVTDIRGGTNFEGLFQALDRLTAMKCSYRILFMDASDGTIIKRYKETRRVHPLGEEYASLEQAIQMERKVLAPPAGAGGLDRGYHRSDPGPAAQQAAVPLFQGERGGEDGGACPLLRLQARGAYGG